LLAVTSPDLLHRGWRQDGDASHVARLLGALPAGARLVTMCDAAPAALSWLGGVLGMRVMPLGVDRFGQTGDLTDLYATYQLDVEAVTAAMASALTGR
jgi:pyruvate dehydrogenase E1 component